ncbi:histone-lysine N-methyltransferase SETMAR-like [Camponotus floridanus]|uniref:histone-lysine N-methyltransferase SETMAR-like n=1 Tax=Camponotus floridanus TaxID=104421 RepID=UPI00059C402B|nr:histone-lysine N-methyltransferase SETMAR-like [Camponotus floridanus]
MENEKVHLRHVMLYEFRKGVSVGTAQKNIQSVYLDRAPALRTVKKWFGRFRNGDFNMEDQPRSGRPSGIDDDIVCALVEKNPRITTEDIAERLNIDNSTAFRHLKKLGYVSKLDTWVPHLLTERNKLNRMTVALSLLERNKKEPFLDRMVTGDEKWILYNNVQRKRTWKKAAEGAEPVAKAGLHPMKVLLCVWWDCRGIIHFELLRRGETITADKYCEQLTRLDAAIREKRPVLANRKGIIFHHDNARPHVAQQTLRKLQELQWEILQHPPYSPDIAPSDFHLFRSLQNSLNGKNLNSEEAVEKHLTNFFQKKPSFFFKNGIDKLVDRWKTIVEENGDYIID